LRKLIARMAQDDESEGIRILVDPEDDYYPGIKWQVFPYWIAISFEDDPEIIACAQVITSKPIGHIEYLSFKESLTPIQKAYAIKLIAENAALIMYRAGIYVATSCIYFGEKQWEKVVKKHWGKLLFKGNVFIRRIR